MDLLIMLSLLLIMAIAIPKIRYQVLEEKYEGQQLVSCLLFKIVDFLIFREILL